jgi:hypothetical protein
MANFTGFSEAQVEILKADLEAARHIAACAARIGPQTSMLLHEAFAIDPAAPDPSQVYQVKNVFAGFAARMATAALVSYPGIGDAYDPEFDSFPDRTRPNTILVRSSYFFKAPFDRALTLLHHYVHLRFPRNPGDGHPGGSMPAFARGSLRIAFDDASRNPYCYEYFARFLRLI